MERKARIYHKSDYQSKSDFIDIQIFNYKLTESSATGYTASNTKPNNASFTILENELIPDNLFQVSNSQGAENYTDYCVQVLEDNVVVFSGIIKATTTKKWQPLYAANEIQVNVADWIALYKIAEKANLISQSWRGYLFNDATGFFPDGWLEADTSSKQIDYLHRLADFNYFNRTDNMETSYLPVVEINVGEPSYQDELLVERTIIGWTFSELLGKTFLSSEQVEFFEIQCGVVWDTNTLSYDLILAYSALIDAAGGGDTKKIITYNRIFGLDQDCNIVDGGIFDPKFDDDTNTGRLSIIDRFKYMSYDTYVDTGNLTLDLINSSPQNGTDWVNGVFTDLSLNPLANLFDRIVDNCNIPFSGILASNDRYLFDQIGINQAFVRVTRTGLNTFGDTGNIGITQNYLQSDRTINLEVTPIIPFGEQEVSDYKIEVKAISSHRKDGIAKIKDSYENRSQGIARRELESTGVDTWTNYIKEYIENEITAGNLEFAALLRWIFYIRPNEEVNNYIDRGYGYSYKQLLDWVTANNKAMFFSENDKIVVRYFTSANIGKSLQTTNIIELTKKPKQAKIQAPTVITFANKDAVDIYFSNQEKGVNAYTFELQNIELEKGSVIQLVLSNYNVVCRVTSVKKDPLFDFIKYTAEEVN